MKQLLVHPKFSSIAILLFFDGLFFSLTNPQKVASWLLGAGVLLFIATLYFTTLGLLAVARWYGVPVNRPARLAKLFVGLAGFLVGMQSIGELGARDIWILLPLGAIAYAYSIRAWTRVTAR